MKGKTSGDMEARFRFGSELCVGDIILTTVPNRTISKAIRIGTAGQFSHVAIYRGEMNVLEAVGVGVTNYSIMRRGVHEKRNVCVLRLNNDIPDWRRIAAQAAACAERYRDRGYWATGAILSVLGNKTNDAQDRVFCSYFVTQVYEDAGITLVNNIEPKNMSPNSILKSKILRDVTSSALFEIPLWQAEQVNIEAIDVKQI